MTVRTFRSMFLRAVVAAIVAVPMAASAQIMTPSIPVPGEEPTDSWAHLSYGHVFKTDIDDFSNTKVQRESALLLLGRTFGEQDAKFKFSTQFAYQLSGYNFFNDNLGTLGGQGLVNTTTKAGKNVGLQCGAATNGAVGTNCGRGLWSDIHQFTFLGLATYKADDDWTVLGGGLFRLSGESGADFSEAMNGGLFTGFLYKWTDTLNVGLLIGAVSAIENGISILPLPLVTWKFADEWAFKLGVNQLGGVGYGPQFMWRPSDEFDLALIWSYEARRFRLSNSGKSGFQGAVGDPCLAAGGNGCSTKNYIGQETSAPLVVRANWHPDPNITVGGFVGVVTAGNVRMETQGGNKVFDKSYGITPMVGANATFRF